ncbi:MAG: carbonic anhydrase [Candidatus Entotheonellia bacterium]
MRLKPSGGAIKGAIDHVKLRHLTTLLAKVRPAVQATAFTGERSSKNPAYVDAVARKNVELTMAHIRAQSAVLRELEATDALKIAGAMYNLDTAMIDFFV